MPKDTKTLGNSKARACESLGFVHKKGCARVLTQPLFAFIGFMVAMRFLWFFYLLFATCLRQDKKVDNVVLNHIYTY